MASLPKLRGYSRRKRNELRDYEPKTARKRINCVSPSKYNAKPEIGEKSLNSIDFSDFSGVKMNISVQNMNILRESLKRDSGKFWLSRN